MLLVEDNKLDVLLVREAFAEYGVAASLHVAEDGEAAMRFIDAVDENENARCPALILLDLNLPKRSGAEVLGYARQSKRCARVKVLIVSSSDSPADRAETGRLGANGYFLKPPSYEDFLKVGEIVRDILEGCSDKM